MFQAQQLREAEVAARALRVELQILKTARALGVTVPRPVLLRADRVIE